MIENIPFSGIFNLAVLSCYRRKTENRHKRAFPQAYEQSCFLNGTEISTWVFAPGLLRQKCFFNIQKLWARVELGDQQNEGMRALKPLVQSVQIEKIDGIEN